MNAWYIDAIDVRAGLAVASFREAGVDTDAFLTDESAVAFLSAPTFAPEVLSSRMVGLGMGRAYAQIGFYSGETEVRFDSLDAVTEFVRRAYQRGAGGDGEGGPGGEDDGRGPEGGLPPFEPRGDGGKDDDPVKVLSDWAKSLAEAVTNTEIGKSTNTPELKFSSDSSADDPVEVRRAVRGALHVLRELFRSQQRSTPHYTDLDWFERTADLCSSMFHLNLCSLAEDELGHPIWAAKWLTDPRPGTSGRKASNIVRVIFEHFDYRWPATSRWLDPVELLARLPVPKNLVLKVPEHQANLLAVLSSAIASPHEFFIGTGHRNSEERAEIVLFAATLLTCSEADLHWRWNSPVRSAIQRRTVQRGLDWLRGNMPKLVFAPDVEKAIGKAAAVARAA